MMTTYLISTYYLLYIDHKEKNSNNLFKKITKEYNF